MPLIFAFELPALARGDAFFAVDGGAVSGFFKTVEPASLKVETEA